MQIRNRTVERRGESRQLVLLVHAFNRSSKAMRDVRDAVENAMPDADILAPDYPSKPLSNTDPMVITESLVDILDEATDNHDYESIVLIGHSLGALLVRKAFVLGLGFAEDSGAGLQGRTKKWAGLVTRIVLMAGVNRGWSLTPKAKHLGWGKWLMMRIGSRVARIIRRGRLIQSVSRGSPFVTNLRIQWINAARADNVQMPLTVQLLGTIDDVVGADDNTDVNCAVQFRFLRVPETGHGNAIDFSGELGNRRRQIFLKALTEPDLEGDLLEQVQQNPDVEHVVFIMHGIRDRGFWTKEIGRKIQALAESRGKTYRVIRSGYGYFPMLRFLFLAERQKNVRWFMDQYTEALARYPKAKFGFIGHSNGTYLLASALQLYRACKFERVAFAGSVVRTRFPWDDMIRRQSVTGVRNYVATSDGIVGVFPGFYEFVGLSDLGSAGHNGFSDNEAKRNQVTFVKGGHAAALHPDVHDSLVGFVVDNQKIEPPVKLIAGDRSSLVKLLSRLNWLVWLVLLIVLVGVGGLIGHFLGVLPVALYAALVLLLLYSV